jgi:hypothetical protein
MGRYKFQPDNYNKGIADMKSFEDVFKRRIKRFRKRYINNE